MTTKKVLKLVTLVVVLYLVFPLIAGLLALGDRDGPRIYPEAYHTVLYMISYEAMRNEKPRQSLEFERPWFYGFPRKRRANNGTPGFLGR